MGASRSEVVRRAVLLAADTATTGTVPARAQAPGLPGELGRVDLVVPVRPESVAWLDEVARVCNWTREQAARQALSEGRRAVDHKPTGTRVTAPALPVGLEPWQDDDALSGAGQRDS